MNSRTQQPFSILNSRFLLIALNCICLLAITTATAFAAERPNVVFILTDDQGWFDVGAHGNTTIETPVMDRLAKDGVEFTRFYASPVCAPTRAALMTGRHHQRTGVVDTFKGLDVLDAREVTIADVFRKAGYRTGCFGKWHLGRYARYHPNSRGFDEYLGFWQYGFMNRYEDSDELWHNRERILATGYITDVLTDAAIDFVKANHKSPFFLYVPYNAPHSPYVAPDRYIEKYLQKGLPLREARIYGMITCLDENIGRLLKTLDDTGVAQNTIVIFMTDNGGVSGHYKAGLRGRKGTVYEGGVRVPFFVRWPGKFPAGKKIDAMVQHIDVFPTLCELIGADPPVDRVIDGKSLLPLIRSETTASPHQYLFHQWNRGKPNPDESWAAFDGRFKLANGELFDLAEDPGEQRNIAARRPDKTRELREAFLAWFADVTAGRDYTHVPIEVGREDENPVELDVTWADPVGQKVKPDYHGYIRDLVDNWTQEGDAIRWKIEVVRPGTYEVQLVYGCAPADAGSVFSISSGAARLEGKTRPTAGSRVFQSEVVGRLDLAAGPANLEIKAEKITGRELMVLHKVWLRRLP